MPYAKNGDVDIFYEATGDGQPVVFAHEFGGDHRAWEPQVRALSRHFQCITYNARGYPPSDVPQDLEAYSQDIAGDDLKAVLDHLSLSKAHLVGLSMGSATVLNFALRHPERTRSMVLCGCGYGSIPDQRDAWLESNAAMEDAFADDPDGTARTYANGPTRVQMKRKDHKGWMQLHEFLRTIDGTGARNILRGIQARRPGVLELEEDLKAFEGPALIIVGDEDEPAIEPSLFLKRRLRRSGLLVVPHSGHAVNQEEPTHFNTALRNFLFQVELNQVPMRDPEARPLR